MRRRARRYALYENPADYRQRGQWRNVVETTAGSLDGLVADRPFGRVVATRRLEPASECDTEGIASLITFVPPGFPEARRGLHPGAGAGMIARFEQQTAVRLKPEDLEARARDTLVQHLQIVFETVSYGRTVARIELGPHHLAPNGYLHGGTVVSLADTSCGYGTIASLPDGAESFTTIELKRHPSPTTAGPPRSGMRMSGTGTATRWRCSDAPRCCFIPARPDPTPAPRCRLNQSTR